MKNFGKKEKNLNDISAIIDCLHDPRVQVNREEFLRNERDFPLPSSGIWLLPAQE